MSKLKDDIPVVLEDTDKVNVAFMTLFGLTACPL